LEAYILPTAVGNFLYIALVSMMASSRNNKRLGSLVAEVFAYTLGVSFMYIVVILE
jgi:hypothetical protein